MGSPPFVLADRVRVEQFHVLGRTPRLFHDYCTWTDEHGTTWAGVRRGNHGFAVTWLGTGWIFDLFARQRRAEMLAAQQQQMELAEQERHEAELTRVIGGLHLGQHSERLLWEIHRQVLAARRSVLRLPDYMLADAVWGRKAQGRPSHWRTDLLERLSGLSWLHGVAWPEEASPPRLDGNTVLLTHVADLRGSPADCCAADCPGRNGPRHHHYLINIGRGFLGVLEAFAQAEDDKGTRSYGFPVGGPKGEGPNLWRVGKTGKLVSVFTPALLGEPAACATFSGRQWRLLQVLVRETSRARRRDRKDVLAPEVFTGNLIPPFHGKRPVACPLLGGDTQYVGFNGNGKRKGQGYRLSTPGGWLAKAGYALTDVRAFLADLTALAAPLGLTIVGVDRTSMLSLKEMRLLAESAAGLRALERVHVRVYTTADYAQRWTAYFLPCPTEEPPALALPRDIAVATLLSDMRTKGIRVLVGSTASAVPTKPSKKRPWFLVVIEGAGARRHRPEHPPPDARAQPLIPDAHQALRADVGRPARSSRFTGPAGGANNGSSRVIFVSLATVSHVSALAPRKRVSESKWEGRRSLQPTARDRETAHGARRTESTSS